MNCAECQKLLVGYLEGVCEGGEKQAVDEHLSACAACRKELQDWTALQQDLVRDGATPAGTNLEDEVMNRIIREQNARLKSAARAGAGLRLGRLAMKSSVVKVAVAAAVVLAAAGGVFLWTGTKSGVVLADVLAKVEQVSAFTFKMTMHVKTRMEGMPAQDANMVGSLLVASEYGMRMEMSSPDPNLGEVVTQQMYMLPRQKTMLMLMPSVKKYLRIQCDDEMFEKKRAENNDPRVMLKKILECQYTDLGKMVRDGVEVQGFQTTDPAYGGGLGDVDVKVWVDVKTQLPVRVEMKIKMGEQMEVEGTQHDFQWDVPVSAAEFNPVVPADFTPMPGDGLKMPAMTEETALSGLKLCLELKGKYPEDLNLMTLMQMAVERSHSEWATAAPKLPQPPDWTERLEQLLKSRPEMPSLPTSSVSPEERKKWSEDMKKWLEEEEKVSAERKKIMDEVDKERNEWRKEAEKRRDAQKKMIDGMDEEMKKVMDRMMPIQALGGFYMTLVQEGKEPAYYGKVVQPGDIAQVLLRWKTGENEYRVIFGDLHAATVNGDTLTKLEAGLPK